MLQLLAVYRETTSYFSVFQKRHKISRMVNDFNKKCRRSHKCCTWYRNLFCFVVSLTRAETVESFSPKYNPKAAEI